jgi:uncharacterized Tic20 family protein
MALTRFFKSANPEENLSFGGKGIPKEIIGEFIKQLLDLGDLADLRNFRLVDRQFNALFNSIFTDMRRYPRLVNQLALYKSISSYQKYSHFAASMIPTHWKERTQEAADRRCDLYINKGISAALLVALAVALFLAYMFIDPTLSNDFSLMELTSKMLMLFGILAGTFSLAIVLPVLMFCCAGVTTVAIELTDEKITEIAQQRKRDLINEFHIAPFAPRRPAI